MSDDFNVTPINSRSKYNEPTALNKVAEFHKTFGHPIKEEIGIPDVDRSRLRVNLLQEELNELTEAINNRDIVEVADALGDIQYVLSGAILEFGLANKFKDIFDAIHNSNMSKVCKSIKEAKDTYNYYKKEGVHTFSVQKGDYWVVYRTKDRKVLKSINYIPVDIKSIL